MDTTALVYQAGLNQYVLTRNLENLTHEDSITSPQPAGNCINWVVGHMVKARNMALGLVGESPLFPSEEFAMYGSSDANPFDAARALTLEELVSRFQAIQEPLVEGMKTISVEALNEKAPFSPTGNPDETVGTLLAGLIFHEAHHSGQIGILRRLLGKPGVIKSA